MGRRGWARARLLGGLLVLAVLVRWLGAGPFLDGLRGLGPGILLAALAIGAGTTICSAWRWRAVGGSLGLGLPLPAAIAASYRAQFLNGVLPGGVLGDVHRGVRHGVDAGHLGRGIRAVVWERTAGQTVQVALAVVVLLLPAFPSPVHAAMPALVAGAALGGIVLLVVVRLLLRHGPARLARGLRGAGREARQALLGPATWPAVLVASLLAVGGHVAMFLLAARAAGVHASTRLVLPLALIVLLGAAIPLNVGGWGPREGVAAWIFAAAGWGAGAGAAVATAFGVMTLVATLPGAAVLLLGRHSRRDAARSERDEPDRASAGVVLSAAGEHGRAYG